MIDLYYAPTPNGHKITLFLEEVGLPYRIHRVNISAGDQFKPDFLSISPNNKIPAIVDQQPVDGGAPISLFEVPPSSKTFYFGAMHPARWLINECFSKIFIVCV